MPKKMRDLADMNKDGKMDWREFSIAMHLIKRKLQGYDIPSSLPASLKQDPAVAVAAPPMSGYATLPAAGGIGGMAAMSSMTMPGHMGAPASAASMTMPGHMGAPASAFPAHGFGGGFGGGAAFSAPASGMVPQMGLLAGPAASGSPSRSRSASGADWSIPHAARLHYSQLFANQDKQRSGFVPGVQARGVLMQSGLSQQFLAQICHMLTGSFSTCGGCPKVAAKPETQAQMKGRENDRGGSAAA
ncbi:PREDICTED: intersectin-1-like [Priapulus caudatus]|uniref:Intersectin-1-like n=1 Tax=Priapulus caudatus TaxID=37621 RepID=A0ABM1ENQ4_PRICU|nr:PREDICTED: intersectin-1-like [Priapulus caudatus]